MARDSTDETDGRQETAKLDEGQFMSAESFGDPLVLFVFFLLFARVGFPEVHSPEEETVSAINKRRVSGTSRPNAHYKSLVTASPFQFFFADEITLQQTRCSLVIE